MSELEKNSDTFVLFNSHYQVYLAIGTGTLMIEANVVHTTAFPETARTFSIYAQAREFMNLLNEYHDKEFEAWGVINSEYIDFFCKIAEPQPQLTIPKSVADELDSVFTGIDATDIGYVLDQTGPYGSKTFNDYYFKNKNIIALYLAGKALGVDLVKVVEND
ncbi:hypothetical protein [Lactococcus taiwanensis]|uniref:hypothetical protein n=1 Tax=Lactococcus taiwanensis TaxID=1151742 RepID=UPI003519D265